LTYYLQILKNKLYRRNGDLPSYGLKMFPDKVFAAAPLAEYPFMRDIL